MKKSSGFKLFVLVVVAGCLSSCASSKRLSYFQNIPQRPGEEIPLEIATYKEPVIQPDDVLSIHINTVDPTAAQVVNVRNGNNPAQPQASSGYLVDKAGFVEVPVLGKVKLAGLTTFQAKEVLYSAASEYYKNPIVEVRFANFRVTVLGEVKNPASYVMPNERVSVLDAIGYAGDLTVYGRRNNVLLIRKDAATGQDVAVRMDMTDKRILNSPYFYLQQNDVIYVEPSKTRILNADNTVPRYLTLAATLVSAWVLLVRYTSVGGN